jgi:predicted ATPase
MEFAPTGLTNLERGRTSFVGREGDLAALDHALESGARLVTVVGAGGIGKTRLAQHFAASRRGRWGGDGGAWFCDLSEARARDDLVVAVAATLGVPLATRKRGPADWIALVGDALAARRRILIVLDNFEQLVDAAPTLEGWLAAAPDARFVVTSRRSLDRQGERLLPLEPLPPADALALLVERAPPHRQGALRKDPVARDLVLALDGLPLAIELAAARTDLLSPRQVLDRLEARFSLLGDAAADRPARHATLEAALAWSWNLLGDVERRVLAQASVFRGGFDADAAEAVLAVAGEGEGAARPAVLDVVASLRDQSLLQDAPSADNPRFTMLESVRAYAALSAEAVAAAPAAARRHAGHYAARGRAWGEATEGGGAAAALRALRADAHNLRAAAAALLADGDGPALAGAAAGLLALLRTDGPSEVARDLLARALPLLEAGPAGATGALSLRCLGALTLLKQERPRESLGLLEGVSLDGAPPAVAAEVELRRGAALAQLGDLDAAARHLEAARARALAAGDALGVAHARLHLATVAHFTGDLGAAVDHTLAAIPELTAHDRRPLLAATQVKLSGYLQGLGRTDDARRHAETARALAREVGDPGLEARAVAMAGMAAHESGRDEDAERLHHEALRQYEALGLRWKAAGHRNAYACFLVEHGRPDRARDELLDAIAYARENDYPRMEAWSLVMLALAHREAGRLREGRDAAEAARACEAAVGDARFVAYNLGLLGAVLADQNERAAAAAAFDDMNARMGAVVDRAFAAACGVFAQHLVLLSAREAASRGEAAAAEACHASVRSAIAALLKTDDPELRVFEVRAAVRGVLRGMPTDSRRAFLAELFDPHGQALVVDAVSASFRPPRGSWISLASRPQLERVLQALAAQRRNAPGTPVSIDALAALAWPDEKMLLESARGRAYKTLSLLRKAGLAEVLQKARDGYFLDPAVPLRDLLRLR